ncbi:metal-dependent transcriptional regulator [uncultured Cytophaga sp.]|uniref:metal-dependent transcriptional regulator n=1 Tax=uncultured Cytophaga sp. TaxID=160238 RepID=UPI00260C70AB|nr:metal-dependent transcriptional regulator [uncultured Cytophaga sp.]
MISQTEENYLKALFNLEQAKGEASVNDISKQLDIKMPTVTSMIKRLAEKALVHYESYKPVTLTDLGKKEAALIIRKHRLTEMFLVEKMGFGWEEVHEIAEHIEHIPSQRFFDKMDDMLNYPTIDPHGSPIPDKNGNLIEEKFVTLSDCTVGNTFVFSAVGSSSEEFLRFLSSRNLILGTRIKILSIEAFDGSMTVQYDHRLAEVLSNKVCEKILVSK